MIGNNTDARFDVVVYRDGRNPERHTDVSAQVADELERKFDTDPDVSQVTVTERRVEKTPKAQLSGLERQVPRYIAAYDAADDLVGELDAIADVNRGSAPLAALKVARDIATQLAGQVTADLVRSARAAGASWADVGASLGMSKQAAQQRFGAAERWDGVSARCEAADLLSGDTDLCEGDPKAVKVFESSRPIAGMAEAKGGTLACVRHGARLYARIDPSRALVYPVGGPNRPDRPAIEVYKRAQAIRAKAAA